MSYRTLVGVAAVLTCLLADPWPGELFQSRNTPQQASKLTYKSMRCHNQDVSHTSQAMPKRITVSLHPDVVNAVLPHKPSYASH